MSTTETKVRHTWATQHTAGHETHGQTAIYDKTTGKDIAIVYDGDAHAELIVRAVNSHADMLEALEDAAVALRTLYPDDPALPKIEKAIARAKGGAQ